MGIEDTIIPAMTLNFADGLSPGEASMLAVLNNLFLRAVQGRRSIATGELIPDCVMSVAREFIIEGSTMIQLLAIAIVSGLIIQMPLVLIVQPVLLIMFRKFESLS